MMPRYSMVMPNMLAYLKLMYITMKKTLMGITVAKQDQKSDCSRLSVKHTFELSFMLFMV